MDSALDGTKLDAIAKLRRPSNKRVVARKRLFGAIQAGEEKKVVWISAPAGSGKTTLVANYIVANKSPCIWYQLDERDADPASFFYYLGLAAQNVGPGNQQPLPLLTPEYLQSVPVFAKRFFEQLAERWMRNLETRLHQPNGHGTIVLDDYQVVAEDSGFQTALNAGLESIPPGINVFVLSRSDPPPAYARLRAAGEMCLLGWEDIRLTADESNAITMLKAGADLSDAMLSNLYLITDGWVAGLVLLIEGMGIEGFADKISSGLPREAIYDYFASELFDRSSPENRAFLLETAFLPRMNAQIAESLTGNPNARRIASDLNRKNYFTNAFAASDHSFKYHPLFREFLKAKAEATMSPDWLRQARLRAAQALKTNGYGEDSVGLLCEVGQWPEAIREILSYAPALIAQGRWLTLQGWIGSIPEPVREQHPWLLFWMGICQLHASPAVSQALFAKSFEKFEQTGDPAGSFMALSGMFDAIVHRLDTFTELDRLIPMIEGLLKKHPQFPTPQIEVRVVNTMLLALLIRQPNNPALPYWENYAFTLVRDLQDREIALRLLLSLMYKSLFSGDLEKVGVILDSFHKKIEASQNEPLAALLLWCFQAFYSWLCLYIEKNQSAVANGLSLAEQTGIHSFDVYLFGHGAAGALSIGDIKRAEQFLKKMSSALQSAPTAWAEELYHCLMAWNHLLKGHPARSSFHADQGIICGKIAGARCAMGNIHLIKAMALHELGEDEKASKYLSEVRTFCDATKLFQLEFLLLLVQANIAFDNQDETSGRNFLRQAMALGRVHGYINSYFWVDAMISRLCVKALEVDIEPDYVQKLIIRRRLIPGPTAFYLDTWPWPLKVYTLGAFEIARDGEAVQFSGKVQKKVLLLLKALIAFGGNHVKEEQLCDALWPDADGDLAHHSLATTLYRLRQLLGKDHGIVHAEGMLSLDRQSCWVDVFALEQLIDEAAALWKADQGTQIASEPDREESPRAILLTQRAVSLYRGHFLDTEPDQPWIIPIRERLREKFRRGVEHLGAHWITVGKPHQAIQCLEKALEVDDLAESFYQHLIALFQQLGNRSAAFATYNRCCVTLENKLGLEPSPKTKALFAALRHGR